MREAIGTGASFGLTSGVITTLGLMVGLHSGTHSRPAVIGGILTIAIADAFSDALGIHVHEEAENEHTTRQIWASTLATLVTKFAVAATFLVPVLLLELRPAILVSLAWGLGLLAVLSAIVARQTGESPGRAIAEHVGIALLVVAIAHAVGDWVAATFH